jgi:hypothetical protein
VFLLQYRNSLYQLENQCRDACDCHHRPHNYHRTCAAALVPQTLRTRSYCLFTICEPSDNLSFHLVHHRDQMHALGQAWQNTNAMSLSVTFASPLSTLFIERPSVS